MNYFAFSSLILISSFKDLHQCGLCRLSIYGDTYTLRGDPSTHRLNAIRSYWKIDKATISAWNIHQAIGSRLDLLEECCNANCSARKRVAKSIHNNYFKVYAHTYATIYSKYDETVLTSKDPLLKCSTCLASLAFDEHDLTWPYSKLQRLVSSNDTYSIERLLQALSQLPLPSHAWRCPRVTSYAPSSALHVRIWQSRRTKIEQNCSWIEFIWSRRFF